MLDKQQIIIRYFSQGHSKKKISRELGLSLPTVKKYIRLHEEQLEKLKATTKEMLPATGIIEVPSYDSSTRQKRRLSEVITKQIDEHLANNKLKRKQGKHKQQLLKKDIYELLFAAGYEISYSTVCRYIRQQEQSHQEVFIRQHYEPGQAVEFDWGMVKLEIGGVKKNLMLAVFTSAYSNHRWAYLYYRQDMSSFVDSHARYFDFTGAVPIEMVYDNMRTAVRKYTLRNADKEPTEALLKMSSYYHFSYRFCNANKGNEKGHVERSVEYVRRKAFGFKDQFESLEQANIYLFERCEGLNERKVEGQEKTIAQNFCFELEWMKTAPPVPYDAARLERLKVDKYSCIKVDTNWYSVPEYLVGRVIEVKIYPQIIKVYDANNECVANHVRYHTRFRHYLDMAHYLQTLRTKPGALKGSLSLQQADQSVRDMFEQHFTKVPKDFVELLLFARQYELSIAQLQQVIERCGQLGGYQNISLDKLKVLLLQKEEMATDQAGQDEFSKNILTHCQQQLKAIQALIDS